MPPAPDVRAHRSKRGSAPASTSERDGRKTNDVDTFIPGDRRRALAAGKAIPDRVVGGGLFADISGFTPLTEALARELGEQRGPEELSRVLELIFDAVLGELHRFDGNVLYFSGDAVTCWFDGDDGSVATACALAMQQAVVRVGTITTPGGTTIQLGMKVAVAAGPARRFVVGDPDIQLIDALAGSLLDRLADLEHHANVGDVLVDAATLDALGSRADLAAVHGKGAERFGVVVGLGESATRPKPPAPPPRLRRSISRQWLLAPVYERLTTAGGEFLAELRPVISMFVRFEGFDFDADDDAPRRLDDFIRRAQGIVDGLGGNVLCLTIGDKGAYLFAAFGSPVAHEDDAARACAAALGLLELEDDTDAGGLQIGLTRGPLFSGAYGHQYRRTFTCLGDAVNLAARLMSAAPVGQVYTAAEVASEATAGFSFEHLEPITVKGKSAPVAANRLVGAGGNAGETRTDTPQRLLGRSRELSALLRAAEEARSAHLRVAAVVAEAGLGKSTLVQETVRQLRSSGVDTYAGAASAVGSGSYQVWRDIWRGLFGMDGGGDPGEQISRAVEAVDPALLPRLPLLGPLLGIPLEDNDLTRSFDAKLRKSSLETLLVRYLSVRAADEPMVLWLDDCHWIDSLSAELLEVVVRTSADLPLLILLTYRAGSFAAPKSAGTSIVELEGLEPDACEELLRSRLTELYGAATPPSDELVKRLVERAEGNPFYLGEIANYLHSRRVDLSDKDAASIELPVSLSTMVLSRVDALAEAPRRTLKVASVLGREFATDELVGAFRDIGERKQVSRHLRRLCSEDLVVRERDAEDGHAFKHAVIRDVTYGSLPYAMRARLHAQVGLWLESAAPESLDLLAHHFWHGTDDEKKRVYLVRAGDAARSRFANDAAVDYFRRALSLLGDAERGDVLMKMGGVLGLTGAWDEAERMFGEAMELAEGLGDATAASWARTERADVMRRQGRFDTAAAELESAGRQFEELGDAVGQGRVLHLLGTIAAQEGEYSDSKSYYERSLAIRVALGDRQSEAALLSNLAILAEYEQDYDQSRSLNEQALAMRTELGDRWGIGVSRNNLGMVACLQGDYRQARVDLEESIRVELEVGDPWMVAMARHTLGHAARELGDLEAAGQHYADALRTFATSGDKWSQCPLLEDVAMLVADRDPASAFRLVGAAEAMREAIKAPRPADQAEKLNEVLEGARHRVDSGVADAELARGREMAPESAVEHALDLCHQAFT